MCTVDVGWAPWEGATSHANGRVWRKASFQAPLPSNLSASPTSSEASVPPRPDPKGATLLPSGRRLSEWCNSFRSCQSQFLSAGETDRNVSTRDSHASLGPPLPRSSLSWIHCCLHSPNARRSLLSVRQSERRNEEDKKRSNKRRLRLADTRDCLYCDAFSRARKIPTSVCNSARTHAPEIRGRGSGDWGGERGIVGGINLGCIPEESRKRVAGSERTKETEGDKRASGSSSMFGTTRNEGVELSKK